VLGDEVTVAFVVGGHGDVRSGVPASLSRKSRNERRRVVLWLLPQLLQHNSRLQQYSTLIAGMSQ
jgi:hypothetical protein